MNTVAGRNDVASAFDSNTGTFVQMKSRDDGQWVSWDFASAVSVSQVYVAIWGIVAKAADIAVECSDDNSTWVEQFRDEAVTYSSDETLITR